MQFPPMPLWLNGIPTFFDPLGSYTGIPAAEDEIPQQDADDL